MRQAHAECLSHPKLSILTTTCSCSCVDELLQLTPAALQAMEKRKTAWHKRHGERMKAREASDKAQLAIEKARQREKARAEQSLIQ